MRPACCTKSSGMALTTLRVNTLRSALTVLGIVIGITAIVGMTSLIRGFDQSLRDTIGTMGPQTIFIAKFSGISLASGRELAELLRRPNMTPADAEAIERQAHSVAMVNLMLGEGGPPTERRMHYQGNQTKLLRIVGSTENFLAVVQVDLDAGRFFTQSRAAPPAGRRRLRPDAVPGAVPLHRPDRESHPDRHRAVHRDRGHGGTAEPGWLQYWTGRRRGDPTHDLPKAVWNPRVRVNRGVMRSVLIAAVPREGVPRAAAMREIEQIMRIRHGLRLDEGERLRADHTGCRPRPVGPGQPGDVSGTFRHLVNRVVGRWHRGHGRDDDLGD